MNRANSVEERILRLNLDHWAKRAIAAEKVVEAVKNITHLRWHTETLLESANLRNPLGWDKAFDTLDQALKEYDGVTPPSSDPSGLPEHEPRNHTPEP